MSLRAPIYRSEVPPQAGLRRFTPRNDIENEIPLYLILIYRLLKFCLAAALNKYLQYISIYSIYCPLNVDKCLNPQMMEQGYPYSVEYHCPYLMELI